MKTSRRTLVAALCAAPLALAAPLASHAQTYPSKPITLVVPFTPGGVADTSARAVAKRLATELGQPIVVDNRAGAGGMVGAEYVARAKADGYTLLFGTTGTMASNAALYRNMRYQADKDFIPVHGLFTNVTVLVVNASRPWRNFKDFLDAARKDPSRITFGSAGPGTMMHLNGELLQAETGIKLTHVPYKGSSPMMVDLLGGNIDASVDYPVTSFPHIQSGKLRPLAVTGGQRLPSMPDVPTVKELGFPGAESVGWSGIFAPTGTPPEVVTRLSDAITRTLKDPDVVKQNRESGGEPTPEMDHKAYPKFVAAETAKWQSLVNRTGLRLD